LAIKDVVFDVSSSGTCGFITYNPLANYRKGASYEIFAGREISVALAKMSFEPKYFNAYESVKLTQDEINSLEGWTNYMKERYPVVGHITASKKKD